MAVEAFAVLVGLMPGHALVGRYTRGVVGFDVTTPVFGRIISALPPRNSLPFSVSGPASRGALASVAGLGVLVVPGGPGSRVSVHFVGLTSLPFISATPTSRGAVCGGSSASTVVRSRAPRSRRFGRYRGRLTGILRGLVAFQGVNV